MGPMREIKLSEDYKFIIDDEDYERVMEKTWQSDSRSEFLNYVVSYEYNKNTKKLKKIKLHRFILKITDKNIKIDHINGDPLDNRKSNLRQCTIAQNQYNLRKRKNCSSKYKGVTWDKNRKKWKAQIKFKGKSRFLGHYLDEIEAAKAYDQMAKELFKEFANLNFKEKK